MKIATWNVNSLKVRLPQVLDWVETHKPDVLALQETKLPDENFPHGEILEAGYQVIYAGQKTYNGVAVLSRSPATDTVTDAPGLEDPQRRILGATIDGVRILNLYVVNGAEVGSEKFTYKMNWLEKVTRLIEQERQQHKDCIVLGDFNIAPADEDVHDPEKCRERILCSTAERQALQRILDLGFTDSFRLFDQQPATFSWWDYRHVAFRRNRGYRIDLVLASPSMAERCTGTWIDKTPRKLERPSDHAPVVAEFRDR